MRTLAFYSLYEDANERQLDLLAAGIDATIEYRPAADISAISSGTGFYHLQVDETDLAAAVAIISPAIDLRVESIAACPRCGSSNVGEVQISAMVDVCLCMIPSMIDFIISRVSGTRYTCGNCKNKYRKNLKSPTSCPTPKMS